MVADHRGFQATGAVPAAGATTNPSLILKAVQKAEYAPLLAVNRDAVSRQPLDEIMDRLLVGFGREILAINILGARVHRGRPRAELTPTPR